MGLEVSKEKHEKLCPLFCSILSLDIVGEVEDQDLGQLARYYLLLQSSTQSKI